MSTTTMMVIEPDTLVRMTICEFLRECGYRVIEGIRADDVWAVLGAQVPLDLVFAEVHLSDESEGFSLAKRMREAHPNIDVVLTSGIIDASEKASELCSRGPIRKPYHPRKLLDRIQQLLERRRSSGLE
jgi:DNA-binding response OmpR family regulator